MIDVPAAAASLRMPADRRVFFGTAMFTGASPLLSVKRFWRERVRYIAHHYANVTVVDWMEAHMPSMMSWEQLRGRMVTVKNGPLSGLSGTLQETHGSYAVVGYRDGNCEFATFNVALTDLKPELKEGEELIA